jgi:hypothetical protein
MIDDHCRQRLNPLASVTGQICTGIQRQHHSSVRTRILFICQSNLGHAFFSHLYFPCFLRIQDTFLDTFVLKKLFRNMRTLKFKSFAYFWLFWHRSLYGKFDYIDQISISKFRNQIIQYGRQRTKPTSVYCTFHSLSQAPNTLSKLQYFQPAIYPDL